MKKKFSIDKQDFATLEEMGYRVRKLSPWHFRISKNDEVCLDAFPTTRTYTMKYGSAFTKGKPYGNLVEVVESELDTYAKFLMQKNHGKN